MNAPSLSKKNAVGCQRLACHFWCHLLWVSKPGWIPHFIACLQGIPQIHLWCNAYLPINGQHGSLVFLIHVLVQVFKISYSLSILSLWIQRGRLPDEAVLNRSLIRVCTDNVIKLLQPSHAASHQHSSHQGNTCFITTKRIVLKVLILIKHWKITKVLTVGKNTCQLL